MSLAELHYAYRESDGWIPDHPEWYDGLDSTPGAAVAAAGVALAGLLAGLVLMVPVYAVLRVEPAIPDLALLLLAAPFSFWAGRTGVIYVGGPLVDYLLGIPRMRAGAGGGA